MALPGRVSSLVAAFVVVLLLGAGIYVRIQHTEDTAEGDDGGDPPLVSATEAFSTDVSIPVEGMAVIQDTLVLSVHAAGQAVASREAVIRSQVSARVDAVEVGESDAVGSGQLLALLDSTEFALGVARARAGVQTAQVNYREATLFDDRVEDPDIRAERDRVARAKSNLDQQEVVLREAELDLARTRVTAPFPGRVASLAVGPGQWVSPGDEMMTIVDLDPIKIEAQVLDGDVGFLEAGRRARVRFSAYPGEEFVGRVVTINPVIDPGTRTSKVTVQITNSDGRILPGMYARVSLEAQRFPDRIMVPREAILERDRRAMVFVHEDGRAKWRYVTTGLENETHIEIVAHPDTDEVLAGEHVLTAGHYTLYHDAPVQLVESVRDAGGRPD